MSPGSRDGVGESDGSQLLEDIEAISKALYSQKAPIDAFLTESKSKYNQGSSRGELLLKDKRSSTWNWKKSLKALTHIGHRKYTCVFSFNVHSIIGLPANFDGYSLSVHWKRKDEVLQTRPSKVFHGMAEFDETLVQKCSIYGGKSLANHSAKYDPKHFFIYVSMLGVPRLDLGKHWVDLTRILPVSLEELEGEKSSGNWSTSFRLTGKARGANLNVSFSFLVTKDDLMNPRGHENATHLLKLLQNRPGMSPYGARATPRNLKMLPCPEGNIAQCMKSGSVPSTQPLDKGLFQGLNPPLELSKSIDLLYCKMDEADKCKLEHLSTEIKSKSDVEFKFSEENDVDGYESDEFSIIDCGIELAGKEELRLDRCTVQIIDGSTEETICLDEIIEDEKVLSVNTSNNAVMDFVCDIHIDESMADDFKYEETKPLMEEIAAEELSSASDHKWTSQSVKTEPPLALGELFELENDLDPKENCARKLISFDECIESVASDFLNMLGLEHGSARFSDADPLSPRERLLRQFEEESLISGDSLFDFTTTDDLQDFGSDDFRDFACEDHDDDFDLSSIIYLAEEKQEEVHHSLRNRRNAKTLEDLETDALMRKWGLNEMDFQHSPRYSSSGFGSPIELPPEEPPKLPSLGEGFGPILETKNGGFLRSMNPSLFQNSRNGQSLIIQCSEPVVLPAEMGYDIMEISQNLALAGTENLCVLTNKLMPLDDITGKTLQQIMAECASCKPVFERKSMLHNKLSCTLRSAFLDHEMDSILVSPDDLSFLAMDKIETLLIEGLRIQCGMTDDEPPTRIDPRSFWPVHEQGNSNLDGSLNLKEVEELQFINMSNDIGLMDLSVPLDDWLRLDAGNLNDDDQNGQHITNILLTHGANYADVVGRLSDDTDSGISARLFGNKLVVGLMVQLRYHTRNYEPVGAPMMCIMQVERFFVDLTHGMSSRISNDTKENEPWPAKESCHETNLEKEDIVHAFKISAIHLLGLNSESKSTHFWGTTMQKQSGSRWLLSSGMVKNFKLPLSKSKAIMRLSSLGVKELTGDILWSVSSQLHDERASSSSTASISFNRNPDVVIPNLSTNLHLGCC